MEEIVRYCGYNSAYGLITDNMQNDELLHLLSDIIDSPEDAADFILETVQDIASRVFDWKDMGTIMADADDIAYRNYRDGD